MFRFSFSIRDVLWLMVVVGMGAGWWIDRIPKTVEVYPHDLTQLCQPGETVKVRILRDGYNAVSPNGGEVQTVRYAGGEHDPRQ